MRFFGSKKPPREAELLAILHALDGLNDRLLRISKDEQGPLTEVETGLLALLEARYLAGATMTGMVNERLLSASQYNYE